MSDNNIFIEGFLMSPMKSGSTWISKVISQHNDVCLLQYPTLNFENNTIESEISNSKLTSIVLARANMKLDKRIARIHYKHNKDMKYIVILRNPIDRTFSHFGHYVNKEKRINWKRYATSGKAIETILHPLSIDIKKMEFDINTDIINRKDNYYSFQPGWVSKSLYYDALNSFYTLFPQKNFLIVHFDDLSKNPFGIYRDVCEFIGVNYSNDIKFLDKVVNKRKKRNSLMDIVKGRRVYKFTKMTDETVSFLSKLYEDDVNKLSALIDEDFVGKWLLR